MSKDPTAAMRFAAQDIAIMYGVLPQESAVGAIFSALLVAVEQEREAIATMVDSESHRAGAQGYSGEPKYTDLRGLANLIRARGKENANDPRR